eukprot:TRINITY_DN61256_c0_g1_i1.p1 TRINITY_DN61256_c0_g1~~TRINITY_DN61256_c0_g1_i1.p1  ORF type:complete len:487 (+),score=62.94 TRINITY_DN61256_c0_g1_i1:73-1533(+)
MTADSLENAVVKDRQPFKSLRSDLNAPRYRQVSCDSLRKSNFFQHSCPSFVSQLAGSLQVEMFNQGDVIIKEGDTADKLYWLQKGEVEVLIANASIRVATLQAGTLFGEMGLFGHLGDAFAKRTATVRALDFCDCRTADRFQFHYILKQFPREMKQFEAIAKERMVALQKSKEDEAKKVKAQKTEQHRQSLLQQGLPREGMLRRRSLALPDRRCTFGNAVRAVLASKRASVGGPSYSVQQTSSFPEVPAVSDVASSDESSDADSEGSEENAAQNDASEHSSENCNEDVMRTHAPQNETAGTHQNSTSFPIRALLVTAADYGKPHGQIDFRLLPPVKIPLPAGSPSRSRTFGQATSSSSRVSSNRGCRNIQGARQPVSPSVTLQTVEQGVQERPESNDSNSNSPRRSCSKDASQAVGGSIHRQRKHGWTNMSSNSGSDCREGKQDVFGPEAAWGRLPEPPCAPKTEQALPSLNKFRRKLHASVFQSN